MVKTILIHLDDKKYKKYSELKERHNKTWEELLEVAFRLTAAGERC